MRVIVYPVDILLAFLQPRLTYILAEAAPRLGVNFNPTHPTSTKRKSPPTLRRRRIRTKLPSIYIGMYLTGS